MEGDRERGTARGSIGPTTWPREGRNGYYIPDDDVRDARSERALDGMLTAPVHRVTGSAVSTGGATTPSQTSGGGSSGLRSQGPIGSEASRIKQSQRMYVPFGDFESAAPRGAAAPLPEQDERGFLPSGAPASSARGNRAHSVHDAGAASASQPSNRHADAVPPAQQWTQGAPRAADAQPCQHRRQSPSGDQAAAGPDRTDSPGLVPHHDAAAADVGRPGASHGGSGAWGHPAQVAKSPFQAYAPSEPTPGEAHSQTVLDVARLLPVDRTQSEIVRDHVNHTANAQVQYCANHTTRAPIRSSFHQRTVVPRRPKPVNLLSVSRTANLLFTPAVQEVLCFRTPRDSAGAERERGVQVQYIFDGPFDDELRERLINVRRRASEAVCLLLLLAQCWTGY